jgi:hypothetical protein
MRTQVRNRAVKLQKRNAGSSKKARKKIRPRSFVLQILYAAPARFYEFLTMQAIRCVVELEG